MKLTLPTQCAAAGLPAATTEYRFHPVRLWRFDFAWPDRLIALEVDGGGWVNGRHSRGAGIEKDCEKFNTACALGWRVLRVTPAMVRDGRALAAIEAAMTGGDQ